MTLQGNGWGRCIFSAVWPAMLPAPQIAILKDTESFNKRILDEPSKVWQEDERRLLDTL